MILELKRQIDVLRCELSRLNNQSGSSANIILELANDKLQLKNNNKVVSTIDLSAYTKKSQVVSGEINDKSIILTKDDDSTIEINDVFKDTGLEFDDNTKKLKIIFADGSEQEVLINITNNTDTPTLNYDADTERLNIHHTDGTETNTEIHTKTYHEHTYEEIKNLKDNGELHKGHYYIITDYDDKHRLKDVKIWLLALENNRLDDNIHVETKYDDHTWKGTYDFVNNKIISLADNQGNYVENGEDDAVMVFGWGNQRYQHVTVERGLLDCRKHSINLSLVKDVIIKENATLKATNISGYIRNLKIYEDSSFTISDNIRLQIKHCIIEPNKQVILENLANPTEVRFKLIKVDINQKLHIKCEKSCHIASSTLNSNDDNFSFGSVDTLAINESIFAPTSEVKFTGYTKIISIVNNSYIEGTFRVNNVKALYMNNTKFKVSSKISLNDIKSCLFEKSKLIDVVLDIKENTSLQDVNINKLHALSAKIKITGVTSTGFDIKECLIYFTNLRLTENCNRIEVVKIIGDGMNGQLEILRRNNHGNAKIGTQDTLNR